jgi:hypothetical protein
MFLGRYFRVFTYGTHSRQPYLHSSLTCINLQINFQAAPPAPGLADRRVEITGPVDRKMVINALNSGASTFMADFEGVLFRVRTCILTLALMDL